MEQIDKNRTSIVSVLLITSMAFIPLSSLGNAIRLLIIVITIGINPGSMRGVPPKLTKNFARMIISLFLPLIAVIAVEGHWQMSLWVHEAIRMAFNILLIMVVYRMRIPFKWIVRICIILLLFNTSIQLLQYLGFNQVTNWIRQYYLVEGSSDIHINLSTTAEGFRSGSIYLNPNVYMPIPLITMGVILQKNSIKPSVGNYLWLLICFVSCILTGSRTALVVAAALIILFLFKDKNSGAFKWFFAVAIVMYLLMKWDVIIEQFRAFDILEGFDKNDSFDVKVSGLKYYLNNSNILYFLMGSLSSSMNIQIDAEWGYIFKFYGILGIVWYVSLLRMMKRNKYSMELLSTFSVLVVGLVAMTASVLLCMSIFPFICLVAFSEIEVTQ